MIVGYILELVLGILFAIALIALPVTNNHDVVINMRRLIEYASQVYFNCAAFFTASIQISCMVVLARKDFAITTAGMGGITVQITWSVALLCILSLLPAFVSLRGGDSEKSSYLLFLFLSCWVLYFYNFISHMIGLFAPSQIGDNAGENGATVISVEDWVKLDSLCLTGVGNMDDREQMILKGFSAIGALLVAVFGFSCLFWYIAKQHSPMKVSCLKRNYCDWCRSIVNVCCIGQVEVFCVILTLFLAVPQVWAIVRLRGVQEALANTTGHQYTDNQWTFGQIVSIMLFVPVAVEVGYLWVSME